MNKRFPVLSIISVIFRIIGWLVIVVGLYLVIYEGIIEPNQEGHRFSGKDLYQIYTGLGSLLLGLIVTAFGELIKVFFAIEQNTRNIKSYQPVSREKPSSNVGSKAIPNGEKLVLCPYCGYKNSGNGKICYNCDKVLF